MVLVNNFEDHNARIPKLAIEASSNGSRSGGDKIFGASRSQLRTSGSIRRTYAALSPDKVDAVSSTLRFRIAGEEPSNGCAAEIGGWIHWSPCWASGREQKNGEAAAMG
jgi:hypothetical protein